MNDRTNLWDEHLDQITAEDANAERLRRRLELRRSSAASRHRDKSKYHRPTDKDQRD